MHFNRRIYTSQPIYHPHQKLRGVTIQYIAFHKYTAHVFPSNIFRINSVLHSSPFNSTIISHPKCDWYYIPKFFGIWTMQLKIDNLNKGFTNSLRLTHRKSKQIFFTVVPCLLILSKFSQQLMHKRTVLKESLKFTLTLKSLN